MSTKLLFISWSLFGQTFHELCEHEFGFRSLYSGFIDNLRIVNLPEHKIHWFLGFSYSPNQFCSVDSCAIFFSRGSALHCILCYLALYWFCRSQQMSIKLLVSVIHEISLLFMENLAALKRHVLFQLTDGCIYALKKSLKPVAGSKDEWV